MNLDFNQIIYNAAVYAIPVLFAITLHEVAHGWVANKLGDSTARMLGRLSLNPIRHVDPIGTILVPFILLLLPGGLLFGWAKPVPVNQNNLNNPRRDMAIVAVAGPTANLLMAIGWAIFMKLSLAVISDPAILTGFHDMAKAGIIFNLILMIFNLLPLPPLDGGRILSNLLPPNLSDIVDKIEPYGFFIIIGLIYFGAFEMIIVPALNFFIGIINQVFFM